MAKQHYKFAGVGKRKTAIARVYMNSGKGNITINNRPMEEYFPTQALQLAFNKSFSVTKTAGKYDANIRVVGGGSSAQAQAASCGIAKALLKANEELRPVLKVEGLLTRDARKKERKKYGQPGARKRFQYSKR
ncbi:MAG: 30S ribosomal protein S9 [Proteobacteria bacterium]|jgi:small subunit ribosomal protein S9|nr:30S ribosomal protein S9 [Pseudomonadota bacterium]